MNVSGLDQYCGDEDGTGRTQPAAKAILICLQTGGVEKHLAAFFDFCIHPDLDGIPGWIDGCQRLPLG